MSRQLKVLEIAPHQSLAVCRACDVDVLLLDREEWNRSGCSLLSAIQTLWGSFGSEHEVPVIVVKVLATPDWEQMKIEDAGAIVVDHCGFDTLIRELNAIPFEGDDLVSEFTVSPEPPGIEDELRDENEQDYEHLLEFLTNVKHDIAE